MQVPGSENLIRQIAFRMRQRPEAKDDNSERRRLQLTSDPDVIYAIGDVHGCLDALVRLERLIVDDARDRAGTKLIVMLGDYVDRGPESCGVLDHLLAGPPAGFRRVCLSGNHDQAFLNVFSRPETLHHWLDIGGFQTLKSYGIGSRELQEHLRSGLKHGVHFIAAAVPVEHLTGLRQLPVSLVTPTYFFSHAGARPGYDLAAQSDDDLMWIRREFMTALPGTFDRIMVHGHTIVPRPCADAVRISLDTGAYRGGGLSAARLDRDGVSFLSVPSA